MPGFIALSPGLKFSSPTLHEIVPAANTQAPLPAEEDSNRICQKAASAPKSPRFTPALSAFWAALNIGIDQYSSCALEMKPLLFRSRPPLACVSTAVS